MMMQLRSLLGQTFEQISSIIDPEDVSFNAHCCIPSSDQDYDVATVGVPYCDCDRGSVRNWSSRYE